MTARVALALALALAGCRTGHAVSVGQTEHADRAPNMAAFLILANGHGRGLTQWASANYASALLDTYAEWAVFEPARGNLMADRPVVDDLVRRIERAAASRDAIDLFIFAHDNDFWRLLWELSARANHKIRLIYNAGCDGASQYRTWLSFGAHAYVGHPNDSCSQMFVHHFQTRWWAGMPLYEAVGEANYDTREMLLDRSDPFGMACRNGQPGELIFQRTAAQIAGDGSIRIDTPVRQGVAQEIVIVGAGHAGLCLGALLRRAGVERFTILEKAERLGGTWRDNVYPGAACDTPAFSYCFSFAQKTDWSKKWAPQPEILGYLEELADRHDLRRHIRFGLELRSARRVEGRWRLRTGTGEELDADVLVSAVGQLGRPRIPPLAGRVEFGGAQFHSAAWQPGWQPDGRDVAVIGSAASAVQLVPAIAPRARRLLVFQRSPNWILPMENRRFRGWEHALFARLPSLARLYRWYIYLAFEARYPVIRGRPYASRKATELALEHLHEQVADPGLRRALTPDYLIAAKRVLLSDEYYPALQRSNVRLITEPIECLRRAGVVTRDGREHPVDGIIYATGFESTAFLAPMEITGDGGARLHERWSGGASAYLGMTVPGFPNLFVMYGPNTNLGHNSILFMLECQARYIVDCLRQMDARGLRSIDVRPDVLERWLRDIDRDLADTAWARVADSWYRHRGGRITNNWPRSTISYFRDTRHADLRDFSVRRAGEPER